MSRPDPVFAEPWHAEVFALTVALNESGHLDWPDWAAAFGATLARHGLERDLDGGNDYFEAWLETLEAVLDARSLAAPGDVERLTEAWRQAYLGTPHGSPVRCPT